MLFITNRVLEQGLTPLPTEGTEFRLARSVNFVFSQQPGRAVFLLLPPQWPF